MELEGDDGGWGITTNVSCLSRFSFNKTNAFVSFDAASVYDVHLLEWYCDFDIASIGIAESAWLDVIGLPDTMNAIELDSSYDAIMLFDDAWCHLFMLAKQPKYDIHAATLDNADWAK